MSSFKTRDEAHADALRVMLEATEGDEDEGGSLTTCVCGRQDLCEMTPEARSAIMDVCGQCERLIFAPPGRA